jgi:hypothetical protein
MMSAVKIPMPGRAASDRAEQGFVIDMATLSPKPKEAA